MAERLRFLAERLLLEPGGVHFPAKALDPFGITAVSPDDLALVCIDANPVLAVRIVTDQPVTRSSAVQASSAWRISAAGAGSGSGRRR